MRATRGSTSRRTSARAATDDDGVALVGRDDEVARLRAWIDESVSVVLRGEPGIGKSTLVAAARAGREHDLVVRGIAVLDSIPYAPIRVARPELAMALPPAELAAALSRGVHGDAYVFVDDLQWCDADTRAVIAELALLRPIIATVRAEMGDAAELVETIMSVGVLIEIGPLDDGAAAALVRALRPAAPRTDVEQYVRAAAGNPMTLQLLARGRASGVDPEAAASVAVAEIDAAARVDLARIALAGAPVAVAPDRRDALVRRGLLTNEADGRCRPRHDLIASAAIEAVDDATRRRIHLELAEATDDMAARAMHLAAAGEHAEAVRAAVRAAERAVTVWARAEALRLVAEHTTPPDTEARRAAAEALSRAGRYREALDLLDDGSARATDAVIRARSHWAISEIDEARAAIEAGLADPRAEPAVTIELLSLRSRIRCRVDWDLDGAIEDGRAAVALAGRSDGLGAAGAHSALGLALFMAGDPSWQPELERAGRQAIADDDVHTAVSVYDTMFFGHLLSGDPQRCAPLAAEMIELTEHSSSAWNGYFRATSLLARINVQGDHRAVLEEARVLGTRRLTVKSNEARRTAQGLALIDSGHDLDAVEFAEESLARASDASARSTASWVLAEALWLAGEAERAIEVTDASLALGVDGFPGAVNAALFGLWARHDLDRALDDRTAAATNSGFPNLAAAHIEAEALAATTAGAAADAFARAGEAWARVSSRASLRARWAAVCCTIDAGDAARAEVELRALERAAAPFGIVWLERRLDAAFRRAGLRRMAAAGARASTADEAMTRTARGQTTAAIARALQVERSTVETHIRNAMQRSGAGTRLQAAALALIAADAAPRPSLRATSTSDGLHVSSGEAPESARVYPLRSIPVRPWRLDHAAAVTGDVEDEDDVTAVVLALVRGAHIDVRVPAECAAARAALMDALARIDEVESAPDAGAPARLEPEDERLVALLAGGASIATAAATLGYSRRTVQRRLAVIRQTLGASSNREAVILARRR